MASEHSFFSALKDSWQAFKKSDTYFKLNGGDPSAPPCEFKPMRMDNNGQFVYMHVQSGRFCYKDNFRYETYYDRNTGELVYSKELPMLEAANRKNLEYSKERGWKAYWQHFSTVNGKLTYPLFREIETDECIEIKSYLKGPCHFQKREIRSQKWIDLSFQEFLQYELPRQFGDKCFKHINQSTDVFFKQELIRRLLRRDAIAIDPKYYDNIIITDIEVCDKILNEPLMASIYRERFKKELRYSYRRTFEEALIYLREYGDYLKLMNEDEKYIRAELEEYFYECHPERKEESESPITQERRCRVV